MIKIFVQNICLHFSKECSAAPVKFAPQFVMGIIQKGYDKGLRRRASMAQKSPSVNHFKPWVFRFSHSTQVVLNLKI